MKTLGLVAITSLLAAVCGCAPPAEVDDTADTEGDDSAALSGSTVLYARNFPTKAGCGAALSNGYYAQYCNGSVSTSFNLAYPGRATINILAYGSNYGGWPTMQVSVDGVVVSTSTVYVSGGYVATPTVAAAGAHSLKIAFTNDAAGSSGDRNLFLGAVTITNPTPPTPSGLGVTLGTTDGNTPATTVLAECSVSVMSGSSGFCGTPVLYTSATYHNVSFNTAQANAVALEQSYLASHGGDAYAFIECDSRTTANQNANPPYREGPICPPTMSTAQCDDFMASLLCY